MCLKDAHLKLEILVSVTQLYSSNTVKNFNKFSHCNFPFQKHYRKKGITVQIFKMDPTKSEEWNDSQFSSHLYPIL